VIGLYWVGKAYQLICRWWAWSRAGRVRRVRLVRPDSWRSDRRRRRT